MEKKTYCIYDKKIVVKFGKRQEKQGKIITIPYEGPRQILCNKPDHCYQCAWNPSNKIKDTELEQRQGYINADGLVSDAKETYRGMIRRANAEI